MATNHSNKAATIHEEFQALSTDTWSLDNLMMFCNYKNISIMPDYIILDNYRDYLEQEGFLTTIDLDEKYHYSPQAFSEYYYGTPDLDFLVMYFSKIDSMYSFNRKKITVLKKERLSDINRIIVKNKDEIKANRNDPTVYRNI